MAGNQVQAVCVRPVAEFLFYHVFARMIFGGASWVRNSKQFQRRPEIAHKKPRSFPKDGIEQVCLMTVRQKKACAGFFVLKHNRFMAGDSRKERTKLTGTAGIAAQIMFGKTGVSFAQVVVPVNHIVALFAVKSV